MAVTANFDAIGRLLTVSGDALDNDQIISRNAAGQLLVNGGGVAVVGGTPTVANTDLMQAFGQGGNDTITLSEANGALPKANLLGGFGNDVLTGGSAGDQLFGQDDNDTLLGKGGNDFLFGGAGNDTLIGGDGDDQMFGEAGDDRAIWNPGDDTDLFEGGDGIDTAEVNGGNGSEVFSLTANGARVRFDRLSPAPFLLDLGTTEKLVVNMNGGDDSFSATGALAALIGVTVDGGAGSDTILGSNGGDFLLGGDGDDRIDGNQGNDTIFMGAGRDGFTWDPGDGSDVISGGGDYDALFFNASNTAETISLSTVGDHALLARNLGNVTMELKEVEAVIVKALGGSDKITVGNLAGSGVSEVSIDLSINGAGDGAADGVEVNGSNGGEVIRVVGSNANYTVTGAGALLSVFSSDAQDQLTVNGLGGDDAIFAVQMTGSVFIELNGGDGNDTLVGNESANRIVGGNGNDYLVGFGGDDTLIDGAGVNTLQGGTGDDRYAVQSLDDTVFEFANEGTDEVQTFLQAYSLRPNVEELVFVNGSVSHTGIGTFENNRFTGAGGNDTFTGAGGADIFSYRNASNGRDTITDFDSVNNSLGHDHIDFTGRGLNFAALTITAGNEGTTIGLANGDGILLKGVFGGVDAGDFLF